MDNQSGPAVSGDTELVDRLRAGDAAAFAGIVRGWSPAMLHVARQYVASHASAEEAVQESGSSRYSTPTTSWTSPIRPRLY